MQLIHVMTFFFHPLAEVKMLFILRTATHTCDSVTLCVIFF